MLSPYATVMDFTDHFGSRVAIEVSNSGSGGSVVNTSRLQQGLEAVSNMMDGYLSRYLPPGGGRATDPAGVLKLHCIRLTCCYLSVALVTEKQQKDCDASVGWLKDVAKGLVNLGLSESGVVIEDPVGGPDFVKPYSPLEGVFNGW